MIVDLAAPLVQTWSEIKDDFGLNWFIYVSMPFMAAFVGWITKLVAVEMSYKPEEFRGVGPIGWQGVVPRRAGQVASSTIELLTANVLRPEELLERIDAKEVVEELRIPLTTAIDEISRELAEDLSPGLWDALPDGAKQAVQRHLHAQAPQIVDRILAEMLSDLSRYIDIQFVAVSTLVRNKSKLTKLMRSLGDDAMGFMRRSGVYFGLGIGLVQLMAWALFHNPWIMPAFGFGVGLVSDWAALNLLFRPVQQRTYLGMFKYQAVIHAKRDKITRGYAKVMAEDLFGPENLFDAVLQGPGSEMLFALLAREVHAAIDAQLGGAAPPVGAITVGSRRYNELKAKAAQLATERAPESIRASHEYARRTIDLESLIVEKMSLLTNEEYESILRPVFKEDEKLVIAVGAILGGCVGELQVLMIELLSRNPH